MSGTGSPFDLALSSPAPVQEGILSGYFEDQATRELLALKDADVLLCSGTYSDREPGGAPIEFSLLSEGSYDQCLLPFVPQNHTPHHHLDLHKLNGQAYPYAGSLDTLNSHLRDTLREAQELGAQVDLNLPDYIRALLPRLMYQPCEDARHFSRQFQPYFSPSAQRARWVRIGRNLALLQGFINLCYHLLHPTEEWRLGVPVGLRAPLVITGGEALELLCAYQLLQLTI